MEKSVLLAGEPMGLFIANEVGELERVNDFTLATCGAELNVAVGLRRLGHKVTYMTKLGDDLFGRKIINTMMDNGIGVDEVMIHKTCPTGFMFKSKVLDGDPAIAYFRKGSAASTLSKADVANLDFSKFDIVHLTGITPALSPSACEASEELNRRSRENGCFFSFDPNLRLQLWDSREIMVECINGIAAKSDLFLPGIKEAVILTGEEKPERIAHYYLSSGSGAVVIKLGMAGAYYADSTGCSGYVPGFCVTDVVDTVGAGDGFAAGVLSGIREGFSLQESVKRGCAVGAVQVMSRGDNDGLPNRRELEDFMSGKAEWRCRYA